MAELRWSVADKRKVLFRHRRSHASTETVKKKQEQIKLNIRLSPKASQVNKVSEQINVTFEEPKIIDN